MSKQDEAICLVLCKSGKFETGEGTCAFVCMNQLGDARRDCSHRREVFGELVDKILANLEALI